MSVEMAQIQAQQAQLSVRERAGNFINRNKMEALGAGMTAFVALGGAACSADSVEVTAGLPTKTGSVVSEGEGIDPATGHETPFAIAGAGSCSPFTPADAQAAQAGELSMFTMDIDDTEVAFLQANPNFAKNMALTSEGRWGFAYDAAGTARPSATENPASAVEALFADEYYVTAPISEATLVHNTYCDKDGNVLDYRDVYLAKGTGTGGFMIESQTVNPETGNRVVKLKSGEVLELPADALIVMVDVTDGVQVTQEPMLAINKAGGDTDGDQAAEVGCMNWLLSVQVGAPTPGESTPPTGGPTTNTTTRVTATTVPTTGTTVPTSGPRVQVGVSPNTSVVDGVGTPNTTDGDDDPENNTTTTTVTGPVTQPTIEVTVPTTAPEAPTTVPIVVTGGIEANVTTGRGN